MGRFVGFPGGASGFPPIYGPAISSLVLREKKCRQGGIIPRRRVPYSRVYKDFLFLLLVLYM
jgi:hypothetical protein